jgi:hypothetical protein
MQRSFKLRGRPMRGLLIGRIGRWRSAQQITLGAFAAVLFAPCAVFAASEKAIGLSPMLAKSTIVSSADPTSANQNFVGETVWNDLAIAEGATGGGVSFYWPIPFMAKQVHQYPCKRRIHGADP